MSDQANEESGGYTSQLFIDDLNAFGYDYVGQARAVPSILHFNNETSPPTPYASYVSLAASVDDVCGWINRRIADGTFTLAMLDSPQDYANAFKQGGYFAETAASYGSDLTAIDNRLFGGNTAVNPPATPNNGTGGSGIQPVTGSTPGISTSVGSFSPWAIGIVVVLAIAMVGKRKSALAMRPYRLKT